MYFRALETFGAVIAGLCSLAVALALVVWGAYRLTEWLEYRVQRQRWPGLWTRRIWSVRCPTCGALPQRLCGSLEPHGPVQVVPHLTRMKEAGVAPEWHSEAIRAYTYDACFVLYGPAGRAHARRMLRSLRAGSNHDRKRAS